MERPTYTDVEIIDGFYFLHIVGFFIYSSFDDSDIEWDIMLP